MHSGIPYASRVMVSTPLSDTLAELRPDLVPWHLRLAGAWRRFKTKLRLRALKRRCDRDGHQLVRNAWIHEETREIGEHHCGCSRCTLFWTETPTFDRKTEPRWVGL